MSNFRPYYIAVDQQRLRDTIVSYLLQGLDAAVDRLIRVMESEIGMHLPGRNVWRQGMVAALGEVYRTINGDLYEVGVGIDLDRFNFHDIVAFITTFGSGHWAGNDSIHAGPQGRMVWGNDLSKGASQSPSQVRTEYLLPNGFNLKGFDWLETSNDIIRQEFRQIIHDAWNSIPESEIIACFSVRRR